MNTIRWSLLRREGVALILTHPAQGLPAVIHWGADPGPLTEEELEALDRATARHTQGESLDAAWRVPLVPQDSDGWAGRPGLLASTANGPVFPRWQATTEQPDEHTLTVHSVDSSAGLQLISQLRVELGGLVTLTHTLENTGGEPVELHWLEATLPVPASAEQITTFTGRWTGEKRPVTACAPPGTTVRETRRGRAGHDSPWVTMLSPEAPRNRSGAIWSVHLGWSADLRHRVDRLTEHPGCLGAGELLRPQEIVLEPGQRYTTPVAFFAHSAQGLDGVSARFHTWIRSRRQHPRTPRPLVLNTWEAVYFDHDPERLEQLARRAADVGVERFVLDDGWFPARRDDTAGLGDWTVATDVWPQGLGPLAELVHSLGMEFGLWFEPEMVNLDSELAHRHPEWILGNPASVPSPDGLSFRHQYVLDLADSDAWSHVHSRISALISELGIDFIKWDHNRDLVEPVHAGIPGTHAQTRAAYRMIRRLKEEHPGLEIESCSSGGARTDLGILAHADRVWASDSNDPLERQEIQRWTELILPPELIGSHVGPSPAHSSGRVTDLSYRAATSLQGSAGFEWDILSCTPEETARITAFGQLYRRLRPLLHGGSVVHPDTGDPGLRVRGVVAQDGSEALYTIATTAALREALPERIQLDGLDPRRTYRISLREEAGPARWGPQTPDWMSGEEVALPGRALIEVGLQLPPLWPAQALIIQLSALGGAPEAA
ncbi:alpha-galactosidase [Nesterenkonia xinjiangensis]|uniref:alpha-galactosidase n=1 Tax=Nesterenkonia xinjiangensis TaxID=225327 RepID=A0A7Z0GNA6_9MICC|nr:alpha-galactosidase [Nesterenkonia xinjiangensis]NYJ78609.1 alpha-galactosidase [Nesterenkonia xinjiangensis]